MSAIPTGAFVRQIIPKFYNYWWLRSPCMVWDDDGYAYFVYLGGDVDSYNSVSHSVDNSYGRKNHRALLQI